MHQKMDFSVMMHLMIDLFGICMLSVSQHPVEKVFENINSASFMLTNPDRMESSAEL